MTRLLLSVCCLLMINTLAIAGMNATISESASNVTESGKRVTVTNGTLSINMPAAPVGGLSIPRVMLLHSFTSMVHSILNWGDNWTQSLPAGDYKIIPFPVALGSTRYISTPIFVTVPPSGLATVLITYHLI